MRTKSTMKTSLQGVLHRHKLIREQQLSCDFLRLPRCRLVAKNVPRSAAFWSKKDTLELFTFTSSDVTGSSLKLFVIPPELTVKDIIMRGTSRYKWSSSLEAITGFETSSNFPLFGIANNPKWKKKWQYDIRSAGRHPYSRTDSSLPSTSAIVLIVLRKNYYRNSLGILCVDIVFSIYVNWHW